ncbi:Photosystem I assembly protein [Nymphaea thermarum]|nr:Photosystem I assembly protein [Nymphaea thermarum]
MRWLASCTYSDRGEEAIRQGDSKIAEAWFDQAAEYWKQAIALTPGGGPSKTPPIPGPPVVAAEMVGIIHVSFVNTKEVLLQIREGEGGCGHCLEVLWKITEGAGGCGQCLWMRDGGTD